MIRTIFLIAITLLTTLKTYAEPPKPFGAVPTERQMVWHEMQYHAFIHFGPNTFTDIEWGHGNEDPQVFNPTELDCRQWVRVIKEAGMKGVVITAKHHDGFCLWPSDYSTHTVRESAWKDGKGDILQELSEACKEYGIKFGIYVSPWDRNHPAYGTDDYNDVYVNTLTEVLTNYGDVYYSFFDGANGEGPNGKKQTYDWPRIHETVRTLQPMAVMFSDGGPDVRWPGTESGYGDETNWSTIREGAFYPGIGGVNDQLLRGHEDGDTWLPTEFDTSIRPGWFYHADQDDRVKSVNKLIDTWYHSVGMNGNLLLNLPPDQRGLIHENDIKALQGLKQYLDVAFSNDLAKNAKAQAMHIREESSEYAPANAIDGDYDTYWTTNDDVKASSLLIDFGEETEINVVRLQEYVPLGQRVEEFSIQVMTDDGFENVAEGKTIGYNRLVKFEPVKTNAVSIMIKAKACPVIANVEVYKVPEMLGTPEISRNREGLVSINSDSPDPDYFYTLDGSEPTTQSMKYKEPFSLTNPATVKVKAFVDDHSKSSETVMAEFDIPPAKWSMEVPARNRRINWVIDGNPNTAWQSNPEQTEFPYDVIVNLGETVNLKGFTYLPSQRGNHESNIYKYSVSTSSDGESWNTVLENQEFSNIGNNPVLQKVMFENSVDAQYLKLTCLSTVSSTNQLNIAEIGVISK